MDRLYKYIFSYKNLLILFTCIVLSGFLISVNKNSQVKVLRSIILDLGGKIQSKFAFIGETFDAIEQNKRLSEINARLLLQNSSLIEAKLENKRLRKLLNYKEKSELKLIAGKVVGKGTIEVLNSITINLGKKDGVELNDPVISINGLVGKILSVGDEYSLCQLLSDRDFRVSALIRKRNAYGILKWKSQQLCELNEVPNSFNIEIGDVVVTSGYSNIYPANIPVGEVVKVMDDKAGLSKKILVKPFVNIYKIKEVFIVKDEKFEELEPNLK